MYESPSIIQRILVCFECHSGFQVEGSHVGLTLFAIVLRAFLERPRLRIHNTGILKTAFPPELKALCMLGSGVVTLPQFPCSSESTEQGSLHIAQ